MYHFNKKDMIHTCPIDVFIAMNLFHSSLLSAFIVGLTWALTALQPAVQAAPINLDLGYASQIAAYELNTVDETPSGSSKTSGSSETKNSNKPTKSHAIPQLGGITLIGVRQEKVLLSRASARKTVEKLWQDFRNKDELHADLLNVDPLNVYVVYTDFDRGFEHATIGIGYPSSILSSREHGESTEVPSGAYSLLMEDIKDSQKVDQAWDKLDQGRSVQAVLERYDLADYSKIEQINVYALYQ